VPLDYYSRLTAEAAVPFYVIEGGWPSVGVGGVASSPEEQRRYIEHHARILEAARVQGWFQITFTDLDPAAFPAGIAPFAHLGLVDVNLQAKPALQVWDEQFRRPLQR
jgi:hypothetical protein